MCCLPVIGSDGACDCSFSVVPPSSSQEHNCDRQMCEFCSGSSGGQQKTIVLIYGIGCCISPKLCSSALLTVFQ